MHGDQAGLLPSVIKQKPVAAIISIVSHSFQTMDERHSTTRTEHELPAARKITRLVKDNLKQPSVYQDALAAHLCSGTLCLAVFQSISITIQQHMQKDEVPATRK